MGTPGSRNRIPERTHEYSAEIGALEDRASEAHKKTSTLTVGPPAAPAANRRRHSLLRPHDGVADPYDSTWTVTFRRRGRSSKSISTTCCQIPSASAPSRSGIVFDGPITAARR